MSSIVTAPFSRSRRLAPSATGKVGGTRKPRGSSLTAHFGDS